MADSAQPRRWYFPNTLVRSAILRPRVIAGVAAGILSLFALSLTLSVSLHWAFAWDIGAMVYLVLAFELMARTPPERIRARAARQDDGRFTLLVLIILAIASSFAAIIGLLGEAKEVGRATRLGFLAAAAFTILISWTVTQVLFAIHYAHEHFWSWIDQLARAHFFFQKKERLTIGTFFISQPRSARPHKPPTYRSAASSCAVL